MKLIKLILLLIAAAGFAFSGTANAQATQPINVSATVPDFCIFNTATSDTDMTFDLSDVATRTTDYEQTITLDWRCSNGFNTSIEISAGGSADQEAREMADGLLTLPYNLFVDALFTTIWGDGTGNTDVANIAGTGMGNVGTTDVHGRILIADAKDAEPGNYSDTVTVTIVQ